MKRTYLIAEAGVNHNGEMALAKELIEVAADCGVDAVKFQLFRADDLTTKTAQPAAYQKENVKTLQSQNDLLRSLELPEDAFLILQHYAHERGLDFMVTPFDERGVSFVQKHCDNLKISSGDLTHGPLLLQAARTQKPIFLSTGMGTLAEVEMALQVLAFGLLHATGMPTLESLEKSYTSEEGHQALQQQVTLLHCVSEYPAPLAEVNLKAIETLRNAFQLEVGYSDHTLGIEVAIAAVARGAAVLEKHFTLDKQLPGPDHLASLSKAELKAMVTAIRNVETALGTGRKHPAYSEIKNRQHVRRSMVARTFISSGTQFSEDNVTFKRPASGASPMLFWTWLGNEATQNYEADEVLCE